MEYGQTLAGVMKLRPIVATLKRGSEMPQPGEPRISQRPFRHNKVINVMNNLTPEPTERSAFTLIELRGWA